MKSNRKIRKTKKEEERKEGEGDIEGERCWEVKKSEKARRRKKRGEEEQDVWGSGLSVAVESDPRSVRVGVRGRKRYQGRRTSGVITRGDLLGPPTGRGPIPGQIRSLWENAKRSAHITQIPALFLVHACLYVRRVLPTNYRISKLNFKHTSIGHSLTSLFLLYL